MPAGTEAVGMAAYIQPILMLVMMVAIFYFILIRPQKKQEKKFKEMLANLQVGDEITTIGGMFGKVTKIKDDSIVMEMGTVEKTAIHLYKWGIKDVKVKEKA